MSLKVNRGGGSEPGKKTRGIEALKKLSRKVKSKLGKPATSEKEKSSGGGVGKHKFKQEGKKEHHSDRACTTGQNLRVKENDETLVWVPLS